MKILANIVIWGEDYVNNFVRYSLASLIGPNRETFELEQHILVFEVMATTKDFKLLNQKPIYQKLKNLFDVIETEIDDVDMSCEASTFKYNRVSENQNKSIINARDKNFDFIAFLYPDFIYSKKFLSNLFSRTLSNPKAVLCPIPFISNDKVEEGIFRRKGYEEITSDGHMISISERDLVKCCLEAPHPVNLGFDFDGSIYGEWPGSYYWNINNEGILIRSFHLHPIAMRIRGQRKEFFEKFDVSLDDELVSRCLNPTDDLDFVQDSDNFAICSLRCEQDPPHTSPGHRSNVRRTCIWAEEFTTRMLTYFSLINFSWHFVEKTSEQWDIQEQRANAFFQSVFKNLSLQDEFLEYEDTETLSARKRRISRGY